MLIDLCVYQTHLCDKKFNSSHLTFSAGGHGWLGMRLVNFVLPPFCVPLSYHDPKLAVVGEGAQPSVLAFASSESFTECGCKVDIHVDR